MIDSGISTPNGKKFSQLIFSVAKCHCTNVYDGSFKGHFSVIRKFLIFGLIFDWQMITLMS